MNKIFIVPLFTSLGVLTGGLVWLLIFDLTFGEIEIEGPAILALGFSMFLGGTVFGISSVVYAIRKKYTKIMPGIALFILSGILACVAVSLFMNWYTGEHYSRCDIPSYKEWCSAS